MSISRFIGRFAGSLLFVCFTHIPLAHAATIGLQPNTAFANPGDSISVDVVISDLGSYTSDSLGAFDVSIGFDINTLSYVGHSLGGFLGDVNLFEAVDVSTDYVGGSANVAEISLLSAFDLNALQPGAFTLATLSFDVIALGEGAVTQLSILPDLLLADAAGGSLAANNAGAVSIEGLPSPVPLPGALLLFLSSVVGLFVVKRGV